MPQPRPLIRKISLCPDPFKLYLALKTSAPSALLESARLSPAMGRYSIIGVKPFLVFDSGKVGSKNPLKELSALMKRFRSAPTVLPFAGGAIGYFGYEAKNLIEPCLGRARKPGPGLPDIYLLFFEEGAVIDHAACQVFVFAKSVAALKNLEQKIKSGLMDQSSPASLPAGRRERSDLNLENQIASSPKLLAMTAKFQKIDRSLSRREFLEKVKKAKEYIRRGEIYQANLSQRFSFPLEFGPEEVYARLRAVNPGCFFGILDAGDFQIISGSPERLVKLEKGVLQTRPIAGTRWRGKTAAQDKKLSRQLMLSPKERAEHLMLVDLERNDMGRVAEYGSVRVDELMVVEDYSHVKHIVSNVRGVLKKGLGAVDVIKAFFPGGTITGVPKVRCMEIIDELEPVARGPYTGSLGYLSFSGNLDLNIVIRSLILRKGRAYLNVGAGIVADSDPQKEYDETLYKAEAVFSSLFGKEPTRDFFKRCGAGH
jgi:anthranilate/para-aminobenzoate synthase component I